MRLALTVTAVGLLLLGVPCAVAAGALAHAHELAQVERTALRGAGRVNSSLGAGDSLELPHVRAGEQLGVYDPAGNLVAGTGPSQADAATHVALAGRTADGVVAGRAIVAVPVRDAEHIIGATRAAGAPGAITRTTTLVVAAIAAVAALALFVAWLVARRAAHRLNRPLAILAAVSTAHADGDLHVRARESGVGELDAVARGINASAEAVTETLARERAFAAEASHQLRTPLTRAKWGLEAALDAPPHELRAAAIDAIHQVDDLAQGVSDLLLLSRSPLELSGTADLVAELQRTADVWTGALAAAGRRLLLEVDHDRPWRVAAPEQAVRHIVQVLVENAHRHGSGTVTLRLREALGGEPDEIVALDVADEGGFQGDWPSLHVGEPSASQRIGLVLAQHLAATARARLVLSSRRPTVVTLYLLRAD